MVVNIAFYENVLFILSLSRNREFTLASCESYLAPRIQRPAPRQSTPRTPQTTFRTPQTTPPPPPPYIRKTLRVVDLKFYEPRNQDNWKNCVLFITDKLNNWFEAFMKKTWQV